MKSSRPILLLLVLIPGLLLSGEYADAFLLASFHPQVQSMGNSSVALGVVSGHAMNNPAGFGSLGKPNISMVYQDYGGLSSNVGGEVFYPVSERYKLGITFVHSGVSDLITRPNLLGLTPDVRRDSVRTLQGRTGDPIDYREDAVILSLAREFEFTINLGWKFFKIPCRLPVGASIKYIDKLLVDNRGLGTGFDVGAQLFFNMGGMTDLLSNTEFSIGLVSTDILNSPVYWNTEHQDAIKGNFSFGFGMSQNIERYESEITFSTSSHSRYESLRQYGVQLNVKDRIHLRGGHDGVTPSFGLGIALKKFIIGYTFSHHELAEMQKIGLNYRF